MVCTHEQQNVAPYGQLLLDIDGTIVDRADISAAMARPLLSALFPSPELGTCRPGRYC